MLHERSDFADLIVTVGEQATTNPALVEKDYWVTEALRVIAARYSGGVVFKGGTSLSKAWRLIQRFSEDVDLLIRQDGAAGEGRTARDRYMKAIESSVGEINGLEPIADGARSERGISRTVAFGYEPRTVLLEGLQPTIILEMGIRGGTHPSEQREIRSILGTVLEASELDDETLAPFEMTVLHARRTLVEKLFALHSACELWTEGRDTALQRQGRLLYDIYFLLGDSDVAEFAGSDDYLALIPEIDDFGREYFPRDHRSPPDMRFATSRALAPPGDLLAALTDDYERSTFLFYGSAPALEDVFERIGEIREQL
jgi:hypothetical protein